MSVVRQTPLETIRLLFELDRDDNPQLYDDLVRFRKGTKRINRLRFLAHEGLMAHLRVVSPAGPAMLPTGPVALPNGEDVAAVPVAGDIFGVPVTDR
ncbi:hypothetical protein P3W85_00365 [Cupriavidus basilensis]|uniref:Uncharacterized protein n=1 Tax=Cupriavidus basilensis TaxID=68895 RepID=A0ABT6AFP2_9BURK|nr:hypothetical protein [Cupriavidus basilensis]MDF3831422.1 hypothetical protein [Cupriavidus basilensis]